MRKKEWTLDELRKLPKTRGEAIAINTIYYFNGNLCKKGHLAPRRFDGKCAECVRIRNLTRNRRYSAGRRKIDQWEDGRLSNSMDLDALIESGLPRSRNEAKKAGSRYFFTGKACKYKHFSPRSVNGGCIQCRREHEIRDREKNRTRHQKRLERERIKTGVPLKSLIGKEVPAYRHGKARSLEQILYSAAKQRARKKGVEFNISVQDINIPTHCPILDIKLSKTWGGVDMNNQARAAQPSLDRIDPRKGYVPGNVIVVSYRANIIKGDGLPVEHRAIAEYIEKEENIMTDSRMG